MKADRIRPQNFDRAYIRIQLAARTPRWWAYWEARPEVSRLVEKEKP